MNDDMKALGLQPELALFRGYVEGLHMSNLAIGLVVSGLDPLEM